MIAEIIGGLLSIVALVYAVALAGWLLELLARIRR